MTAKRRWNGRKRSFASGADVRREGKQKEELQIAWGKTEMERRKGGKTEMERREGGGRGEGKMEGGRGCDWAAAGVECRRRHRRQLRSRFQRP